MNKQYSTIGVFKNIHNTFSYDRYRFGYCASVYENKVLNAGLKLRRMRIEIHDKISDSMSL